MTKIGDKEKYQDKLKKEEKELDEKLKVLMAAVEKLDKKVKVSQSKNRTLITELNFMLQMRLREGDRHKQL